jgi:hypothetical protein
MDPENIATFTSYSGCVDQRSAGAREAAKYGAVGQLYVLWTCEDDFPHTGAMGYGDFTQNQIISPQQQLVQWRWITETLKAILI